MNSKKLKTKKTKPTRKKGKRDWKLGDVLDFCTETDLPLDLILAVAKNNIPIYTMKLPPDVKTNFVFAVDMSLRRKLDSFLKERSLHV